MIPTRFAYEAPEDAAEASRLLAGDPDGTRILGGGTWVVPELSRGESTPRVVLDLARAGLGTIESSDAGLRIGAMVSYADLLASAAVADVTPLLHRVAGEITGGWSIRHQATVGGSVAAARPQSDIPGALVACGAQAIIQGAHGTRRIPVGELIVDAMRTSLGRDELLAAFDIPRWSEGGLGYVKLKRYASSWPLATASAGITVRDGVCSSARLVLGAVSARPVVVDVAATLVGERLTHAALERASRAAAAAVTEPWTDGLAPASYRAAVAGPVALRALTMAWTDQARAE